MFASASKASYDFARAIADEDERRARRKKLPTQRNPNTGRNIITNSGGKKSKAKWVPNKSKPIVSTSKGVGRPPINGSVNNNSHNTATAATTTTTTTSHNNNSHNKDDDDMIIKDSIINDSSHGSDYNTSQPFKAAMKHTITDMRDASVAVLLDTASEIVQQQTEQSKMLTNAKERVERMPHFSIREVTLGRVLGRGGFCVVREIEKIRMLDAQGRKIKPARRGKGNTSAAGSASTRSSVLSRLFRFKRKGSLNPGTTSSRRSQRSQPKRADSYSLREGGFDNDLGELSEVGEDKEFDQPLPMTSGKGGDQGMALAFDFTSSKDFVVRNAKTSKYVLKRVCLDLKHEDKVTFMKGTVDLAMEANFLGALHHPNIISLIGVSDRDPSEEGFFIIIEKLHETLTKRFKTWSTADRTCKGITGVIIGSKKKSEDLMKERLEAALDIASGGSYLHRNRIVFRDLKPDNIGFDNNNCLKLFDFGLAKELNEEERVMNGLYRMTGMTGAMRYMAPEVGLNKPYNLTTDVYSWAMIMWYILALEPPFGFYTQDMILDRVFQRKSRPAIFKAWPTEISSLMQRAWSHNISKRPGFDEVCSVLRQELYDGGSTVAGSSIGGD